MLSAKIGLLRANIIKNKSTKIFCKTMSSKFFHPHKSKKMPNDFTMNKSTKFSENNLTNTLPSSKYRLSSNKEDTLFFNIEDFHKKFILSKNTKLKLDYQTISNSDINRKVINLKKSPLSPSILSSSSESKSRAIPLLQRNKEKYLKNKEEKAKTVSFSDYFGINENINIKNGNDNNKIMKIVENDKIKSKLLNSEYIKNNVNIPSLKNYNIFRTYNNSIKNKKKKKKNNLYLDADFSKSRETVENCNNKNTSNDNNENQKDIIKIYYGRNNPKLIDRFAYPNIHHSIRIEPSKEFFYKTKLIIFNKYRNYLNKNAYLEHQVKKNFDVDKGLIQERNIKLFEKLFAIYEKSLDEYLQFLQKKIRETKDEDDYLAKEKYKILGDIEKINVNIMKGMSKIKDGISIKYFMTCVKNHTLSQDKFSPEDLIEIENDRQKLNQSYYLPNAYGRKKQSRKSIRKNSIINVIQVKRNFEHSLTKKFNRIPEKKFSILPEQIHRNLSKKNTRENITLSKKFTILNTVEEFLDNLDFISSKVYNLIIDYNNRYQKNVSLRFELENLIKNSSNEIIHSNYLESKISAYEEKLKDLKSKNANLLSKLNNLKDNQFQQDVKLLLVLHYIHQIYNNIKKADNNIITITKEMVISYGERYYLNIIEKFFFKLLLEVNDIKKSNPTLYSAFKTKFDRQKKKRAFYKYQRLLAEKIRIKVDKVLQKAEKIIYKPIRKTNDYKREHKKRKIKKKEIKKSNWEIFAEYLDDDSY